MRGGWNFYGGYFAFDVIGQQLNPLKKQRYFLSILGTLTASLAVVIYSILGKNPETEAQLQSKVESQQRHIETLVEKKMLPPGDARKRR